MTKNQGTLSGFRDLLAEEMLSRQKMIDTIKKVYESYGFSPLDTPSIERYETLAGKYGSEGEKLMYKFTDHGKRQVALRYDLTVPLARVILQHKDKIPLPYKRYQVGNVWRGESPQTGRYREFMQFDADIVGTKSALADAEVIMMMYDAMKALGVDAIIKVNNRKILDGLTEKIGIKEPEKAKKIISLIDKAEKIGRQRLINEIESEFGTKTKNLVSEFLSIEGNTQDRLKKISKLLDNNFAKEGISNLYEVLAILNKTGYKSPQIIFDQTIARGLDYYTGIIYETTLADLPKIGSVCSGGRFDSLISVLSDGKIDLPAVGTSVGVDRLFTALQELGNIKPTKTKSQVMIVNFDEKQAAEYTKLAKKLRALGIATEVYYDAVKLDKQLKYADKIGVPWVIFLGTEEIEKGVIKVKNLESGEQKLMSVDSFISLLKKS